MESRGAVGDGGRRKDTERKGLAWKDDEAVRKPDKQERRKKVIEGQNRILRTLANGNEHRRRCCVVERDLVRENACHRPL